MIVSALLQLTPLCGRAARRGRLQITGYTVRILPQLGRIERREALRVRELVDIFKALADETRLQILALLLERGELCVCDIVGVLDITQSKASRHLRYLFNSGLLMDRRDGVWIHYRISSELSPEARTILDTFQHTLDGPGKQELLNRLDLWLDHKVAGGFGTCLR